MKLARGLGITWGVEEGVVLPAILNPPLLSRASRPQGACSNSNEAAFGRALHLPEEPTCRARLAPRKSLISTLHLPLVGIHVAPIYQRSIMGALVLVRGHLEGLAARTELWIDEVFFNDLKFNKNQA
eukprot:scaffold164654_cov49-Prasinocladus_malaysianus.AAC.2